MPERKRPETAPEPPETAPGMDDSAPSVLSAVRAAGDTRKLSVTDNPVYAALCLLAHRMDDPFLPVDRLSSLMTEYRQYCKILGMINEPKPESQENDPMAAMKARLKAVQ